MADSNKISETPLDTKKVDLDSLKELSFGPSWLEGKSSTKKDLNKDNKKDKPRSFSTKDNNGAKDRRGLTKKSSSYKSKNFKNVLTAKNDLYDIKIYPEDETFDAIIKRLKNNFKTYQLFEITRLILEKPNRFVFSITLLDEKSNNEFFFTDEDKIPFEKKEELVDFFFQKYSEKYFIINSINCEPPKGNFKIICRCPITSHLIAPPNFHLYQDMLKSHFNSKIKNKSFDDYQKSIIQDEDPSSVDKWLESMKQKYQYVLKSDDSISFDSAEEAKKFLLKKNDIIIINSSKSYRLNGDKTEALVDGDLKTFLNDELEKQRKFPLDTANNIRGRLRRHKFTIYKKGNKGISYVCAVKRKFRNESTVFTDRISNLINYLEQNQNISIVKLPYNFLNLEHPKTILKDSSDKDKSKIETTNENNLDSKGISENDKLKLDQVLKDLKWLITEGYVTIYSDGSLYVHPKILQNSKTKIEDSTGED